MRTRAGQARPSTALTAFQRLETLGRWQASAAEPLIEVVVQLGEATLTISDGKMIAVSHWSLPAVERLNPGEEPARYGTGEDCPEVLEVDDPLMVGALEKVLASLMRRRAQPRRRLRRSVLVGGFVAALLACSIVLPPALVSEALTVAPFAKRVELGEALLSELRASGAVQCDEPMGRRALERLRMRLLPDARGRIVVMRGGPAKGQYLPGGLIVLSNDMVVEHDDPAVLAGHVLALDEAARARDPLELLLEDAGVFGTAQLLTTGKLAGRYISAYAKELAAASPPRPKDEALIARMSAADVPVGPYAKSLGEKGAGLAEAPPLPAGQRRPVLADDDWVALQQICAE